jgi:NAD(P)H-dependent flavin oxidoreductase YrpB (nitropropane dioxygenase family)
LWGEQLPIFEIGYLPQKVRHISLLLSSSFANDFFQTDVGNFVLQPVAARRLKIPYVTSGGVGDGKQLAASLAMGAEGVNMGTRFMATVEVRKEEGSKQASKQAAPSLVERTNTSG